MNIVVFYVQKIEHYSITSHAGLKKRKIMDITTKENFKPIIITWLMTLRTYFNLGNQKSNVHLIPCSQVCVRVG